MPCNRIRQYKIRKETERRAQETKTVQNKKINGKAYTRKKTRKETARRPRETKKNEKIEQKQKQARKLRAKFKIKNNKQGKFEPSQFTRKENSDDPRRIQAHQIW